MSKVVLKPTTKTTSTSTTAAAASVAPAPTMRITRTTTTNKIFGAVVAAAGVKSTSTTTNPIVSIAVSMESKFDNQCSILAKQQQQAAAAAAAAAAAVTNVTKKKRMALVDINNAVASNANGGVAGGEGVKEVSKRSRFGGNLASVMPSFGSKKNVTSENTAASLCPPVQPLPKKTAGIILNQTDIYISREDFK